MLKKLMIALLSMFFVALGIFMIVVLVFFLIPSRSAQAGISLPSQVEDSVEATEAATESDSDTYDNIYLADVHESLSLRTEPDSNAETKADLAPMTHMQIINYVDDTNFAYVEVINGDYEGLKGYVNCEYITKMGEPTIRVGTDE